MERLQGRYANARSRICNAYLIALFVLSLPALGASLSRIATIGWQPLMGLHIVMATLLLVVTVFRRRIAYRIRVGFVIFFFVAIGLAGVWTFGLVSGAISLLVGGPVLATLFLNLRTGLIFLAVTAFGFGVIGVAIVSGYRVSPVDPGAYVVSREAWLVLLFGWTLVTGTLAVAVGTLNRVLLEALDASERHADALQQSEGQYRRLIQNLPQIIFSWSSTSGTVYNSPRVEQILGYSPEHLREHPHLWEERIHPDDWPQVEKAKKGLMQGRPFNMDYRIRDAAGEWHWVRDDTIEIRRENGGVIVDGIITDITAQRLAEEQLRQAQKMEAVGQLTGGIAHDFNNLMSIVALNTEFLEEEYAGDEKARAWLKMIRQAVDRAAALTYRLMAFSRQQVLQPVVTDIGELLYGLRELLERTLGEDITIEIDSPADLWPAEIDQSQLENALLNLAINARDAMPDGGLLKISATNRPVAAAGNGQAELAPGDYVVITVSDTGTGMSPEVMNRMFEPFFTTKQIGEGSGLGLSMVYGFVMQSLGSVNVESAVGEGTTIEISLPRAGEQAAPQHSAP